MYEKFVSLKLFSLCEKYGSLPAAQFAYWKGLGCIDALLTTSHHLQKSLDALMESHIVQLYFSAAFDRVSHSGLLFKLKSIGVGGSIKAKIFYGQEPPSGECGFNYQLLAVIY